MAVDQARSEMEQAELALNPYSDPDISTKVRQGVMDKWSPLLKSSTDATQRMMADFLPRYMELPYGGYAGGTGSTDLTPGQKMTHMARGMGTMGGRLASASTLSGLLGGRQEAASERAMESLRMGQQTAQQKYDRAWQKYQFEQQLAEAERARQLQRQQMQQQQFDWDSLYGDGGGGGGGDDFRIEVPEGGTPQHIADAAKQHQRELYNQSRLASEAMSKRLRTQRVAQQSLYGPLLPIQQGVQKGWDWLKNKFN